MSRILKLVLVAFLGVVAAGVIMPVLARDTRTGSKKYARIWRDQLFECKSLEDVRRRFACFEVKEDSEGRLEYVPSEEPTATKPLALIQSFSDGNWVACVHSCTHGPYSGVGGGTVVSKDSEGAVHIYFGHICNRLWVSGETLDEFYSSLEEWYEIQEVESD